MITGQPLTARVLFVANHVSWVDILVMAGATGCRFVAKDEVAGWPVIGWLAGLHHTVFIARARRGQVQDQADRLSQALADARPLTLFAEGGTGDGASLRPFRASLFAAVMPAPDGVRVQPVAIDYTDARDAAWADDAGFGEDALRLLGLAGQRRVTLRFGTPIDPATFPDRKAIAAACQAEVAHMLGVGGPAGV